MRPVLLLTCPAPDAPEGECAMCCYLLALPLMPLRVNEPCIVTYLPCPWSSWGWMRHALLLTWPAPDAPEGECAMHCYLLGLPLMPLRVNEPCIVTYLACPWCPWGWMCHVLLLTWPAPDAPEGKWAMLFTWPASDAPEGECAMHCYLLGLPLMPLRVNEPCIVTYLACPWCPWGWMCHVLLLTWPAPDAPEGEWAMLFTWPASDAPEGECAMHCYLLALPLMPLRVNEPCVVTYLPCPWCPWGWMRHALLLTCPAPDAPEGECAMCCYLLALPLIPLRVNAPCIVTYLPCPWCPWGWMRHVLLLTWPAPDAPEGECTMHCYLLALPLMVNAPCVVTYLPCPWCPWGWMHHVLLLTCPAPDAPEGECAMCCCNAGECCMGECCMGECCILEGWVGGDDARVLSSIDVEPPWLLLLLNMEQKIFVETYRYATANIHELIYDFVIRKLGNLHAC